ncbi:MAG TPA: cytochrome c biogenesis protein CcsA, partial [Gillisia sp.]|nr:cytochrome c biogenesis protein CcsA [Gillisia sp.]
TRRDGKGDVKIFKEDSLWMVQSSKDMQIVEMSSQRMGMLRAGETMPLQMRSLYQVDSVAFLIKAIHEGKQIVYHADDHGMATDQIDVIKLRVTDADGNELLNTFNPLVSREPQKHVFFVDDSKYILSYGPREEMLPFALQLRAFELQRYPGSESPSSYASEVQVIDHDGSFPYRIFMNNVLDHKGFRFYQASYDTDEKGTVLSVSQDRPGTYITYFSYTLLTIGMFFTFFVKGSRFSLLNRRLKTLSEKEKRRSGKVSAEGKRPVINNPEAEERPKIFIPKTTIITILIILGFLFASMKAFTQEPLPDVRHTVVPIEHAETYGALVVQDLDGRMKPLNTLANEITRKLSGRTVITVVQKDGNIELTAEQFLLAMQLDPAAYSTLPLIKVDPKKANLIFTTLEKEPVDKLSFKGLLDDDGRYLLQDIVEEANRLKPAERNEAHKELLKVDERFNIFYAILRGDFLKMFPHKEDANNKWFAANEHTSFNPEDAQFVQNITPLYLSALGKGFVSGNYNEAYEVLSYIRLFQEKAGAAVYPEDKLLAAELFYNELNLGNRLFGFFWILGIFMLILAVVKLFQNHKWVNISWDTGLVFAWLGLVLFTFHLGLRWYIAGRAPWSDGFEMLVFVAWCILLFGLLFEKKSHFTVPLGVLFAGTLLFVAFLDWLNPEITNLMPVLHSYWLKIHVAIIVSGYAPLALAALLAMLTLILLIFKPANPSKKWWKSMQELSMVNEMSITIGLFLLAIGTFLGGVWANESWGRYWAWDPKETWALISIMVYAFVLHLRLIPKFKNALVLNIVSLWAFSSIIMTSFGVNYYLSGLHSYASGDPVPMPEWIYWMIAALIIISRLAVIRYKKLSKKERKNLLAI